ncbi:MAG: aspartate aminotransferase family protein [Thermoprotei archaeon]
MSNRLSFSEAPLIRVEPPGPKASALLAAQDRWETGSRTYSKFFRTAFDVGSGSTIRDVDGNVFVDWFSGICVLNLGHAHPAVLGALRAQLDRLVHINEVPTEARVGFLEDLVSTLPGSLRGHAKVMFTVTGADACEAAMSLARWTTKRRTIVSFSGAYHGVHGAVVGATANYHYREYAGVPPYAVYHLPYPYTYRFPFKVAEGDESKVVVEMLERLLEDEYAGPGPIAGVMVEPIQGEGGYIVPPDDFLPMLREVTEKHSVPLIVDEVQSGVGRTGRIWASEHSGVTPDIMCVGKSIGGGIPFSLIAYREDLDRDLPPGFHLGTYRGNPLGLAAGRAVLGVLRGEGFLDRVRSKGEELKKRFEEFQASIPQIGEVRGKGYMIGVELVDDPVKKTPSKLAGRLREEMFRRGVLMHTCGHYGNVMRFMAPLTIEDDLVTAGLRVFESSLKSLVEK